MPITRLEKNKDGASKYEVATETASYLSSDERGDEEVVEAEVADFIDDYYNDEYGWKFEGHPSKKRRGGICRK